LAVGIVTNLAADIVTNLAVGIVTNLAVGIVTNLAVDIVTNLAVNNLSIAFVIELGAGILIGNPALTALGVCILIVTHLTDIPSLISLLELIL